MGQMLRTKGYEELLSGQSVSLVTVLTGTGALLGALIVVIVQSITGVYQRRQERMLKVFDARLRLYISFCTETEELYIERQEIAEIRSNMGVMNESLRKKTERIAALETTSQLHVREVEVGKLTKEVDELEQELDRITSKLDNVETSARELGIRLVGTRSAIMLIADRPVQEQIAIFDKQSSDESSAKASPRSHEPPNLKPFLRTARKDLRIVD